MPGEEWQESILARQRILFQEQLDQHHHAIAEAIDQVRDRLENNSAALKVRDRLENAVSRQVTPQAKCSANELQANADSSTLGHEDTAEASQATETPGTSKGSVKHGRHSLVSAHRPVEAPSNCRERVTRWLRGPIGNIVGIFIILNSISMFVHAEWLGSMADSSLGIDRANWSSAKEVFIIVECVFAFLFMVELLLNCYAYRFEYFKSWFNILDTAIVLTTSLEVFILAPLAMDSANVSCVRLLRLAKIARALKIARSMSHFNSLRLLISSFVYSLSSLFWSMVVMFLLTLMCAVFLCQTLHDFIIDERKDIATRAWVNDLYGSGHRALYTSFEMTFSGCWPNYVRRVIEEVHPLYAVFFVLYITVVFFGVIRVISVLFIKETLAQAARDTETMVWERQKKSKHLKKELEELFEEADMSGDGVVALDELEGLLWHPKVGMWFRELGIDAEDARMLFDLLDDGDGRMTQKEFVNGVAKLKGEARAQDIVPIAVNCERLLALAKRTQNTCDCVAAMMDEKINGMLSAQLGTCGPVRGPEDQTRSGPRGPEVALEPSATSPPRGSLACNGCSSSVSSRSSGGSRRSGF